MNIHGYKLRIQKLKRMLKSRNSKYSDKKLENWVLGCRIKIEKLRKSRPKVKRPFKRKKR